MARPTASVSIWRRGWRLSQLTTRRPGRNGVDCPACSSPPRQDPQTVAKAATLRSAPAIEVAMLRSGRVLQRSKNRFDSPMACRRQFCFRSASRRLAQPFFWPEPRPGSTCAQTLSCASSWRDPGNRSPELLLLLRHGDVIIPRRLDLGGCSPQRTIVIVGIR